MRAKIILVAAAMLTTACITTGTGNVKKARRTTLSQDDLTRARKSAGQSGGTQAKKPLDANGAGEVARSWAYDQGLYAQVRSVDRRDDHYIVQLEVVRPQPGKRTVTVHATTGKVTPALGGGSARPTK